MNVKIVACTGSHDLCTKRIVLLEEATEAEL